MNSLIKTAILGLPLLFVGCTCTVETGESVSSDPDWNDKHLVISETRWIARSDTNNKFQTMTFYTVCIEGVNYLWEYQRDKMHVKYNRDGSVSTCDDSTEVYQLSQ